jgi:hypothetical protein
MEQIGIELVLRIPECFRFQTYTDPSFSEEKYSPAAATGKEEESGLYIRFLVEEGSTKISTKVNHLW